MVDKFIAAAAEACLIFIVYATPSSITQGRTGILGELQCR